MHNSIIIILFSFRRVVDVCWRHPSKLEGAKNKGLFDLYLALNMFWLFNGKAFHHHLFCSKNPTKIFHNFCPIIFSFPIRPLHLIVHFYKKKLVHFILVLCFWLTNFWYILLSKDNAVLAENIIIFHCKSP